MTTARRALINAETTPYYHIITRCVRRAFLCGIDKRTGKDFSYRRNWLEKKLFNLIQIFALDIAAYAIMNNHYHLILRINQSLVDSWSREQIIEQYSKLHTPAVIVQRYINNEILSKAEHFALKEYMKVYRERLCSISWFMKCLNEYIARKANLEDKCTGKFWESRFKSQALLDENALLTCMAYVDLNPIRAGLTDKPETSDYTSIQARLKKSVTSKLLLPFVKPNDENLTSIPITQTAYFQLVDWTGRSNREDKRGYIPQHIAPILQRINMSQHEWLRQTQFFEAKFKRVAGTLQSIRRAAKSLGRHWFHASPSKTKLEPT